MKKLLLLVAALTSMTAKSQTSAYHPFPEDTATWVTDIYYNTCMGYCSSTFYEMRGDTIINGNTYNKIYNRNGNFYYMPTPNPPLVGASFSGCSYVGAIRQDSINEKVYFIDSTLSTDTLLYDFNLSIGDTVQSWYIKWGWQYQLIVTSIDSIFLNGSYHKRINFNQCCQNSIIEGVGWAGELFGLNAVSNMYVALACFNGNVIVQEAFITECSIPLNCSINVDIIEQTESKFFYLFPNPFSDKLNFTYNNNKLSEIIIYDIASRKLLQQKFTNSITLSTEQLARGIYFYEVQCGSSLCKKGKLVKD